jgi:hypothetical protein
MKLLIQIFMVSVFWPAILGHMLTDRSIDWGMSEGGLVEGFAVFVAFLGVCFMVGGTLAYWVGVLLLCGVDMSWLAAGGSSRSGGYPIIIPMRF